LSIAKLQELFQKSGCGLVVLIVCASVMLGGVFYYTCTYNGAGTSGADAGEGRAVMHVAGVPVTAEEINKEMEQMPGGAPDMQSMIIGQMINQRQQEGAEIAAVQQSGAKTDDATILAAANDYFDTQIDQMRQRLIQEKKLTPLSSQADFDKAVKAQTGKTIAELKSQQTKSITDAIKDSDKRRKIIASLARTLLLMSARAKHAASDAEVRASYQTYNFEAIRFFATPANKASIDSKIQEAENDLKKGVPFEKVMATYSNVPPTPHKPGPEIVHYTKRELDTIPGIKPLADMKLGQVSPVIDAMGSKTIFKLVSTTSNLPKDYDKSPEKYRKEYIDQAANSDVDQEIQKAKNTPNLVKFDSPAYKALYDASQAGGGMMQISPIGPPQAGGLQKAYDEAVAAEKGPDARIAALARYEAETALWNRGDKAKMRSQRIETLLSTLQYIEDFDVRMELVDDYLAEGKKLEAAQQLLQAAQNNSKYDDSGVTHFTTIRDKLQQMEKDKTVDSKTAAQIESAQLAWTRARADNEAQEAIMKKEVAKQQAEDAKMRAEEAKQMEKARAEADKKAKEAAAKSKAAGGKPASTGGGIPLNPVAPKSSVGGGTASTPGSTGTTAGTPTAGRPMTGTPPTGSAPKGTAGKATTGTKTP
jgi:hypothetical protein